MPTARLVLGLASIHALEVGPPPELVLLAAVLVIVGVFAGLGCLVAIRRRDRRTAVACGIAALVTLGAGVWLYPSLVIRPL
jgi:NO-binding membrane sensor protein with MHYT domain